MINISLKIECFNLYNFNAPLIDRLGEGNYGCSVVKVLRMNAGDGDASYAHNSLLQKKVLSVTKVIREEAMQKVQDSFPTARSISMADLGCSSGPNTLWIIHEFITSIRNIRRESGNQLPVDVQVFLNDLPGNDFNTLFKSLPSFQNQLMNELGQGFINFFVNATPGSFYHRLFPTQSVHFVHASYSLHYLSQVPKGLGRSNKSNIYLGSSSPESVIKAYYEHFQTDLETFLKHRSEELVKGGCLVFTLLGRKSQDPTTRECACIWELLSSVLNQMVSEGLIEEERLDLFNIPEYMPSPTEIETAVEKEGSFAINGLRVSEVDWDAATYDVDDEHGGERKEGAQFGFVKCIRAVKEAMLAHHFHFGEALMDQVFRRYGQILVDTMARERAFLVNVTASLTKN